jgi:glycerol-3-phosphate dehydrogenase (NAD(P)+)
VPLVWVCKGFEAGSGKLPHEVVAEVLGSDAVCGALSGPSFAEEVASGQPTAVALAANDHEFAIQAARQLHGRRLRVYANDDLVGVEVGGAVKNVLAIATGVCDGLGLGLNSRAALMTRGLAEIARLGVALGAHRDTFMGLAGMGDLILTCTGDLSRNRRVGLGLAQGKPLSQILDELGHVAEGVPTSREVDRLASDLGIDMPISAAVAALLDGRLSAPEALERLMARDPREESE